MSESELKTPGLYRYFSEHVGHHEFVEVAAMEFDHEICGQWRARRLGGPWFPARMFFTGDFSGPIPPDPEKDACRAALQELLGAVTESSKISAASKDSDAFDALRRLHSAVESAKAALSPEGGQG